MLRLPLVNNRVFYQSGSWAGLNTCATRNTIGAHKVLSLSCNHFGIKSTPLDGQRKGALNFGTGSDTARANDAFCGIKIKIRITGVFHSGEMTATFKSVTHFSQPDFASHVLQFAVTVCRTGQAVEWMIRDIKFQHVFSQSGDAFILRSYD